MSLKQEDVVFQILREDYSKTDKKVSQKDKKVFEHIFCELFTI